MPNPPLSERPWPNYAPSDSLPPARAYLGAIVWKCQQNLPPIAPPNPMTDAYYAVIQAHATFCFQNANHGLHREEVNEGGMDNVSDPSQGRKLCYDEVVACHSLIFSPVPPDTESLMAALDSISHGGAGGPPGG